MNMVNSHKLMVIFTRVIKFNIIFIGNLKDGKKNGKGEFKSANGDVYKGNYN